MSEIVSFPEEEGSASWQLLVIELCEVEEMELVDQLTSLWRTARAARRVTPIVSSCGHEAELQTFSATERRATSS